MKQKKFSLTEAEYRRAKRAIKRLENIKPDISEIQKKVWLIKNKLK